MTALEKFKAGEWLTNYYQVLGHDAFWVQLNRAATSELIPMGECVVHYGQAIACLHTSQKALELSRLVLKLHSERLERMQQVVATLVAKKLPVHRVFLVKFRASDPTNIYTKYVFVKPAPNGDVKLDQQVALEKFKAECPGVTILSIEEWQK